MDCLIAVKYFFVFAQLLGKIITFFVMFFSPTQTVLKLQSFVFAQPTFISAIFHHQFFCSRYSLNFFLLLLFSFENGFRMNVFEPLVQSLERLLVICLFIGFLLILFHAHDSSKQIMLSFQSEYLHFYSSFAM